MTAIEVRCPRCGTLTVYSSENPFRPFCSERCRLIDLGKWADGDYRIPGPPPEEESDERPQVDTGEGFGDSEPSED